MFSDFSGNAKEKWVEISSYIKSSISLAKQREDPRAHEAVFKEVPIQRIESQVKEKFKELFQQDPSTSVKIMRDLAVYELVSWFKKDFFKWVDALKCYDGVCDGVPMPAIRTMQSRMSAQHVPTGPAPGSVPVNHVLSLKLKPKTCRNKLLISSWTN